MSPSWFLLLFREIHVISPFIQQWWHVNLFKMVLPDRVYINVGGQRFLTKWATLQQPNCSRLSQLSASDPTYDPDNNEFYFDRSCLLFECVIDMHRTGTLHLPHGVCVPKMVDELRFWDIPIENVACCCWARIQEYTRTAERIQELRNIHENESAVGSGIEPRSNCKNSDIPVSQARITNADVSCFRKAANSIFNVMERPRSSHLAMVSNQPIDNKSRRSNNVLTCILCPSVRSLSNQCREIRKSVLPDNISTWTHWGRVTHICVI